MDMDFVADSDAVTYYISYLLLLNLLSEIKSLQGSKTSLLKLGIILYCNQKHLKFLNNIVLG